MANDRYYKLDARNGLGKGILRPRFHKPVERLVYYEEDDSIPSERDISFVRGFNNKLAQPRSFDHGPSVSHDDLYMEGDTFLSPIPDLYKNRDGHLGTKPLPFPGPSSGFRSSGKKSGERRGWNYNPGEEEDEEHIYSLEQLALKQLREYIKLQLMDIV